MEKNEGTIASQATEKNNSNVSVNASAGVLANSDMPSRRLCNKWVSLILCIFLGFLGGHKFYEGKAGMGVLYIFTCGLFFIGVICDVISILMKPNPYEI